MKTLVNIILLASLFFFSSENEIVAQNAPVFKAPQHLAGAQFNYPELTGDKSGNYNLDFYLTINEEAPEFYWAHQFYFVDGDIGYMGLQTVTKPNGENTKVALFSIWNSLKAESSVNGTSEDYSHEGSGFATRIEYDWKQGKQYRLRLWKIGALDTKNVESWWGAWVTDMETDKAEFIGKILVPAKWQKLNPISVNFTEYYGSYDGKEHPCTIIGNVTTTYAFPTMNNGTIKPKSHSLSNKSACKDYISTNDIGESTYQVLIRTKQ